MASTRDATQNAEVLKRIQSGWLTSYEALMELGVARLASRINDLKNANVPIVKRRVEVLARNGRIAHVTAYRYGLDS
ncbi:MAG: helix-turn-helix domain-containing protein [Usitatibacter sp.]